MADTKYILRYVPLFYEELEEKVETKGLSKQSFSLDDYLHDSSPIQPFTVSAA